MFKEQLRTLFSTPCSDCSVSLRATTLFWMLPPASLYPERRKPTCTTSNGSSQGLISCRNVLLPRRRQVEVFYSNEHGSAALGAIVALKACIPSSNKAMTTEAFSWKIARILLPFPGVQHSSFEGGKNGFLGCLLTINAILIQQKLNTERHHPWTKTELWEKMPLVPPV